MRIVITDNGWLANLPKLERPVRLRHIFDVATEAGWTIDLPGMHWTE